MSFFYFLTNFLESKRKHFSESNCNTISAKNKRVIKALDNNM